MKNKLLYVLIILSSCSHPNIEIGEVSYNSYRPSVRGLCMVNENIAWASGTKGVIQYTVNGKDWISVVHDELKGLDFRDIYAFNEKEALIMSSGNGCKILKTSNSGKTWDLVYHNPDSAIFFDGMDFWDANNGIAFGDPVNNELFIIITKDGGYTWEKLNPFTLPKTLMAEAGFAASGTSIQCIEDSMVVIGTGGDEYARIFISHDRGNNWKTINTPMRSGEVSGIYSLVFLDRLNGVLVGGNYLDSTSTEGNCVYTSDGGKTWFRPITPPNGYRSCVTSDKGILFTCGRTGVDVSFDKGKTWKQLSNKGFYTSAIKGRKGWLFGRNGRYAQIKITH